MITETETAFLAVVRAFLTEEKAALEELAALTEKQWNHLFVMAAQHSLLSAVYDVVGKTPEFAGLPGGAARTGKNTGDAEHFTAGFAHSAVSFR